MKKGNFHVDIGKKYQDLDTKKAISLKRKRKKRKRSTVICQ